MRDETACCNCCVSQFGCFPICSLALGMLGYPGCNLWDVLGYILQLDLTYQQVGTEQN